MYIAPCAHIPKVGDIITGLQSDNDADDDNDDADDDADDDDNDDADDDDYDDPDDDAGDDDAVAGILLFSRTGLIHISKVRCLAKRYLCTILLCNKDLYNLDEKLNVNSIIIMLVPPPPLQQPLTCSLLRVS